VGQPAYRRLGWTSGGANGSGNVGVGIGGVTGGLGGLGGTVGGVTGGLGRLGGTVGGATVVSAAWVDIWAVPVGVATSASVQAEEPAVSAVWVEQSVG